MPHNAMGFPRDEVYHGDSDADDEFERSVMTSPTQLATDSESESDPLSNEHTPTTFGLGENGDLPKSIITEWTPEECAHFIANLNLAQYYDAFIEHGIVGEALVALKQDELKEMGIASVGHRLTILKNVYDVKISQDVPIEADDYVPQSAEQSQQHENATKEELARVARSIIRLRDERIAQVESQLLRLAEDYQKLRTELLPFVKTTKSYASYPPNITSDVYSEGILSPPATAQPISEKPSITRSLSKKFGLSGNIPKNNHSPTYIPSTIHEGRPMTDSSSLNPSAAASAASNQLSGAMHNHSPSTIPSPTSPMPYHQPLTAKTYQPSIDASRPDGHDDINSRPYPTPTPPIIHKPPKSAINSEFSMGSMSTASTYIPPRGMSASVPPQVGRPTDRDRPSHQASNQERPPPAPQGDGEAPSVEIFKSFRVALEDPCYKVLPAALRKYNIHADWRQYALYIVYGDQERCVGLEEKPLALFKDLDREGKKPMFMLRKLANSVDLNGMPGMSGPPTAGIGTSKPLMPGGLPTPGIGIPPGGLRNLPPGSANLPGGVL